MIIEIKFIKKDIPNGTFIKEFAGDELTSPESQAILYLQMLQQKEMVV